MSVIRPEDPVRVLVSEPLAWIEPEVSLAALAAKLDLEQVGAVAVMSGDRLDGIISERDIVRALAACCTPGDVWAADVMATPPALIDGDEPIAAAAERMLDEGVRHLPVLLDGHVLSVVSMRDVLRVFSDDWRRSTRES
jgi:CBS domain-containing protein